MVRTRAAPPPITPAAATLARVMVMTFEDAATAPPAAAVAAEPAAPVAVVPAAAPVTKALEATVPVAAPEATEPVAADPAAVEPAAAPDAALPEAADPVETEEIAAPAAAAPAITSSFDTMPSHTEEGTASSTPSRADLTILSNSVSCPKAILLLFQSLLQ